MSTWNKHPRSSSKLISFFRQIVVAEQDGSRLYNHVEQIKGFSAYSVQAKISKLANEEQNKEFQEMLINSSGIFPVICSVHSFLKKHDQKWHSSQKQLNN